MAPPASLEYSGCVCAKCSILVISPSLLLYSAISSNPFLPTKDASKVTASVVANCEYSRASAIHPISPSRYVPAPTTLWPGRGSPVAIAQIASNIFILSASFCRWSVADAFLIVWPALFPIGAVFSFWVFSLVGRCPSPCISPINISLPSPPLSKHYLTHEHRPFNVDNTWTCWPLIEASSFAMSNRDPHAAIYWWT